MGWMAIAAAGIGLATQMMKKDEKGAEGGAGGIGTKALEQAIRAQGTRQASERPFEEIEPATSAKERGEYLMRMLQAIQNNETKDTSAMDSVAASLMRDMQAGTGRIQEEPVVLPQEPSVPKVQAVKLPELEQEEKEEKEQEPFVRGPSLFG